MDNGIHIGSKDNYIEKHVQVSAELSLIGKGDGAEVMIQKIKSNELVFIEPGEYSELMEFFYILEGELEIEEGNSMIMLNKGDYFYSNLLKEPIQLHTISDVTLLYFSTQPMFHYLSAITKELVDLAKNVEEKDKYTHSHIQRVKDYAVKIANRLGLSKEKVENIGFSSLFHDLGKINIPDEILNKPGKLTENEFEYIKQHPNDGADLVKGTCFENISEIIRQHHERIDGTGYPRGLKDKEIMIEAKIIAVADTYDAMTSDRAYRAGFSPEVAVEELERLKGIHYDSKVVNALISILKEDNIM